MTSISIRHKPIRRGHYRAVFHDAPDFTLLVPIAWTGHFRFQDLMRWPNGGKWKQLVYVPAPRRPARQSGIRL